MIVRNLVAAEADILDAADWYDRHTPGRGTKFVAEVDRTRERIEKSPHAFGRVPRCPRGREVRELKVARFQYKVVYEVRATEVVVLAVTHTRSRRQPWRRRLGGP